jgi:hypothetical protein
MSMEEGRTLLKQQAPGKWKVAPYPGDGRVRYNFQCNAHINCDKWMRVVNIGDSFDIQEKGEHGVDVTVKKRKNSALSWAEEAVVMQGIHQGGRPGAMVVAMTKAVADELRSAGKDPLKEKKPTGGLQGMTPVLQKACIVWLHVSRVLSPCIFACISCSVNMYLACISCSVNMYPCMYLVLRRCS